MSDAVGCLLKGVVDGFKFLWNRYTCNTLVGVVLPRCTSKTFIAKNFTASKKDSLIVDLEEAVLCSVAVEDAERIRKLRNDGQQETANTLFYPMVRDWMEKLKRDFRFKTVYVLSSDLKLVKYLGIREIHCFVPSNDFAQVIESHLEDGMQAVAKASRLDLLLQVGKKCVAFSDWQNLGTLLAQIVKIVPKL